MSTGMLTGRLPRGDWFDPLAGPLEEGDVSIEQAQEWKGRHNGTRQCSVWPQRKTVREERPVSEIPVRKRGVVAVARRGGLFLAIRRGQTVRAGGRVCFPGGHIEAGEAEREAVVRECREELAAAVEPGACVWRSVTSWGTALAWWTVRLADEAELVPHPVEVDEILWLTVESLLAEPDLLEGNREFLEAVIRGDLQV
jgi:8-oxo-dGTP diphosphatase